MANVAFEPAGSCTVQTTDPSWRESAMSSPVNVVVHTRSLEIVAPPNGNCGRWVVHSGLPVAMSMATISPDRKSTRLNSSHQIISYAVFCLKKKKNQFGH